MAAEVELHAVSAAPHAVDGLGRDLVGMVHLAPFARHLLAHLVVVGDGG